MTFATHPERQFMQYLRGRGWVDRTPGSGSKERDFLSNDRRWVERPNDACASKSAVQGEGEMSSECRETHSSPPNSPKNARPLESSPRNTFERFPKDRYQTEVESWRHLQSANIEFTIKRLREPIDASTIISWGGRRKK